MTLSGLKPGSGDQVLTAVGLPELSMPDKASLLVELVEAYKSADQVH